MTTDELKGLVDRATPEERLFLEHHLAHLRRVNDPKHAAELTKRMKEMDDGMKFSWPDVQKLLVTADPKD